MRETIVILSWLWNYFAQCLESTIPKGIREKRTRRKEKMGYFGGCPDG